ncbi:MAG: transglutaminase domain-containing protein, partial [Oscillospiraceae bacterium]|nr:transglutaminase domain-containing protein [Oscillospiraceae bacterium]
MWDKVKKLTQHPAVQVLKKICGDPVQLYTVFLVMTVMYYYHEAWTWLYTLLCVGLSFVLMRFYDFVAKHRFIGPVTYLGFLVAGLYAVSMLTNIGRRQYPITFAVWFLTPQSVVDFSMLYTVSIYLLMVGFLTSTVYYFAKVRYRMTMQFLIMLIPLSLYAKEGLQMPALLVILLLASYFLLMIYCRQLRETEQIRRISGLQNGISVGLYVTAFSIIAAIIPKPAFQADREFIENAMSYSTWSDVLMDAISIFTDSTDNRAATNNNARTLFYVDADESLRLRTQTYSYYQADDSWNVKDIYDRPERSYEEPLTYKPQDLLQAICDAAAKDAAFAKRYGLTEIAGMVLPAQEERELYVYTWFGFRTLPSSTRTYQLDNTDYFQDLLLSENKTFDVNMQNRGVSMHYYPDTYARYETVHTILSQISQDEYADLLTDAEEILSGTEAAELLRMVQRELSEAWTYLYVVDYEDWQSDVVDELSASLTEGLTSDMDKALAIERYFTEAGYVYDAAYEKAEGENIEDFLLTTHRGVCYEYATAMTLLCRSAGLPARYVQGYSLHETYNSNTSRYSRWEGRDTNYVIKARDAHAFPEVYISGYGWLSFEPTVASDEEEGGIA